VGSSASAGRPALPRSSTPTRELAEREQAKMASLTEAGAEALRQRGLAATSAP
jgi:hypothetical protein